MSRTRRSLPLYKNINYFIDVKESKRYYKRYQKRLIRRMIDNEEFEFYSFKDLKITCKDGWNWSKVRNDETVKQYLRKYKEENKNEC